MSAHGSLLSTVDLRTGVRRAYIVEIREPGRGSRRVLVEDLVEVGRRVAPAAAGMVTVRHSGVPRRHARLQVLGGELTVTDLGSMNGTLVNGERVGGTARLALGDTVSLAAVDLIVVGARTSHETSASAASAPGEHPPSRPAAPLPPAEPEPTPATRPFPNYLQLRRRVPAGAWVVPQVIAVASVVALCVALVWRPAAGLQVLWRLVVPVLPLLWLVAPGVWRNSCPLAATNQLPRRIRIGRAAPPPTWLRDRGYVVAVVLFLVLIPSRKVLFDHSGPATAILLIGAMCGALAGGLLFSGKSGWCSSVCPLLPIQRLYGQTPFVTVPNSHCRPCVGCAKHCYDFNPRVAYQADLHDADPRWTAPRKFFAGCLPGVVVGFFVVPGPPAVSPVRFYLAFFAVVLASAGSLFAVEALVRLRVSTLAAVYGAVGLCTYYWFAAATLGSTVHDLTGAPAQAIAWPLRAAVFGVAAIWVGRTLGRSRLFLQWSVQTQPLRLAPAGMARLANDAGCEVTFQPEGRRVVAAVGDSLLDLAEKDGLPIEAGCRMGVCGADPVTVLAGADQLSPATDDERATLRRLDLGAQARLACCARVRGPVTVSLDARTAAVASTVADVEVPASAQVRRRAASTRRVVIIGNGIAGVTAAQEVRRTDPDCELHIVGREPHPLYNRMGISRVVYGRSAMAGLFLLADDWYERRDVSCWLNTRAVGIDLAGRTVALGTGEELAFDRLILATGARADVPPIPGAATPGCFVLRDADDAVRIRAYVQEHRASRAIVVGAGPLAVEGAYALHELGLDVSMVVRGHAILRRHIDQRCAALLTGYLGARGIAIVAGSAVAAIHGTDRVRSATLVDGRHMQTDLVLLAVGATPDAELARAAGLTVGHGVLVDEELRTSAAGVYAAGDVAELRGQVTGLWPAAVAQATAAAANALGEHQTVLAAAPPMLLKGVGIDLVSVGRVQPVAGDTVLVREDPERYSYGRLVTSDGRVAGAVLLNLPREAPAILTAVRAGAPTRSLDTVRSVQWRIRGG
jgi:nitrite reductase (NADH) large subunit